MPISIGIITAKASLENIRSVDAQMRKHCKITYIPYNTLPELCSQYSSSIRKYDGILFSGPFPRDYILENVSSITKPYYCIDLKDRDYYLAIARIFAAYPGIDFSRVYFDMISDPSIIQNVFPNGNGPYVPRTSTPLEYRGLLRSAVYERFMNIYRSYWHEKRFDIFVTRFINLADQLEAEHIPHILLKPLPESILDCFYVLLNHIKEAMTQNSLVACCIIELPEGSRTHENCAKLEVALSAFNEMQGHNLMIRKNSPHFEVITSVMQARELTAGYSSCPLTEELGKALPFPVQIGWGIDFDVIAAYKNAKKAILASRKDRSHSTYLVTESQEMVGPLNSNRSISYDLQPDAQVYSLAKVLRIAPVNLMKMVSLQRTRQMFEFTSSDLVFFLEITPRSASRILLKLAEGGFARPVRSVNLNGTGRPTTVYEIDFSTINA